MKLQIAIVVAVLVVYEASGDLLQLPKSRKCISETECLTGECCAKQVGPHILSRDVFTTPDPATVEGICKPYLKKDEWCGGIFALNGECGCDPALVCHRYLPKDLGTVGKRSIMPGNYLCEPKEMGP